MATSEFLPYVPSHKRKVGEVCPQTSPERFSVADVKKEIAVLRRINKRLGWHPLRAEAIDRLEAHITARTAAGTAPEDRQADDAEQRLRREGRCNYQTGIEWSRLEYCGHPADPDLYATDLEGLCTRHGRQAAGIDDPEINVGDRVRDTDPDADPGHLGTVTAVDNDGYRVRWDGQSAETQAEYGELDPIDPSPPSPNSPQPPQAGTGIAAAAATAAPSPETTGLESALAYTTQMAGNLRQAVTGIHTSVAALLTGGVTGPAITALQAAQESMTTAAAHLDTAHAALRRHVGVQEAYAANRDAGTRRFLTTD